VLWCIWSFLKIDFLLDNRKVYGMKLLATGIRHSSSTAL
jgi:hypothetical protein